MEIISLASVGGTKSMQSKHKPSHLWRYLSYFQCNLASMSNNLFGGMLGQ